MTDMLLAFAIVCLGIGGLTASRRIVKVEQRLDELERRRS